MKTKTTNKRNKVLKLFNDDPNISLNELLDNNSEIVSRHIILSICDAIDKNLQKVEVLEISNPVSIINVVTDKEYYYNALLVNMKILIKHEDYKICKKALDYIKKLEAEK